LVSETVDKLTEKIGRGAYAIEIMKEICPGSTLEEVVKIRGGALTRMIEKGSLMFNVDLSWDEFHGNMTGSTYITPKYAA
jgi:hypothetical protein